MWTSRGGEGDCTQRRKEAWSSVLSSTGHSQSDRTLRQVISGDLPKPLRHIQKGLSQAEPSPLRKCGFKFLWSPCTRTDCFLYCQQPAIHRNPFGGRQSSWSLRWGFIHST